MIPSPSSDHDALRWWMRPPTMQEKAAHRFYSRCRKRHAPVRVSPYPARRKITGLLAILTPEQRAKALSTPSSQERSRA